VLEKWHRCELRRRAAHGSWSTFVNSGEIIYFLASAAIARGVHRKHSPLLDDSLAGVSILIGSSRISIGPGDRDRPFELH